MSFDTEFGSDTNSIHDVTEATSATEVTTMVTHTNPQPKDRQMKQAQLHLDTKERQKAYVEAQKAKGGSMGVVFQDAFIRGMRDLGYKDPSWAIAELIDNSVQADSRSVDIRFGFGKQNATKAMNPTEIAIIDDGNGMLPDMLGYAVRWGGTDREGDRNGFGRFGYGLPSACVSLACRYTVYSKLAAGDWYAVTVDLEKLAKASSDTTETERLLAARKCAPPVWLKSGIGTENQLDVDALVHGTIIVLEDLDRLQGMAGWKQVKSLKDRLLKQYGLIYRHWIPEFGIFVAGSKAEAVDPLFLLPHARYYSETPVMAIKVTETAFEVEARSGEKGTVRIRAALLPPLFTWVTPNDLSSEANKNQRWNQVVAPKERLNGLIICREGRQIDVVQPEWTKFQNYDAHIKIEIDFDPVLDEFFNITTSKQQVRIDDLMLDKLRDSGQNCGGLGQLIKDMRPEVKAMFAKLKADKENAVKDKTKPLPAATAMAEAERFKSKTPRPSPEAKAEALKNFENEVDAQAKESGESKDLIRTKLVEVAKTRPWDIDFVSIEEGPFFIPKRMGQQKRILLNTAHPFYSRLYEKASPEVASALSVLLFVLADGEIDASENVAEFYKSERNKWSGLLNVALKALVSQSSLDDDSSSKIEEDEVQISAK